MNLGKNKKLTRDIEAKRQNRYLVYFGEKSSMNIISQSTLIRFTSSEYADSYLTGELYLSSLWKFWDFTKGKIRHEDVVAGKVTEQEIQNAIRMDKNRRFDLSEGIAAQIPRDKVPLLKTLFGDHIIHDVRFRLSAYKYCNIMCFFRVDAASLDWGCVDEDNISRLLKSRGRNVPAEEIRAMDPIQTRKLVDGISDYKAYELNRVNIVQLPAESMDNFGDIVVVIKNEAEFKRRVKSAVNRQGGHCVMGDIRYHKIEDRVDSRTLDMHSITLVPSVPGGVDFSDEKWPIKGNGCFSIGMLSGIKDDIYWRGCLDKYDNYGVQNEWRICWLPEELDYHDKTLSVGRLDDIIDIVKTEDIRTYLLNNRYKGYIPGFVSNPRKDVCGTETYEDFMERMKRIDGMGDFVFEVC